MLSFRITLRFLKSGLRRSRLLNLLDLILED
jgi:hypothetical protein